MYDVFRLADDRLPARIRHLRHLGANTAADGQTFQGLSVGGEYGTSATYMSEVAIEGRKGYYASFQYVTLIGGQLLALLTVVVLQQLLPHEALRSWGWRIPFGLGAVLAIVALFLRRSLDETTDDKTRQHQDAGRLRGLWKHRRAFNGAGFHRWRLA